uniref:Tail tubular protein n=1 Tax=Enterobacter phage vB_EclP_26 TaxID=3161160 RepID=A0AAU7VEJ0_9CAUD
MPLYTQSIKNLKGGISQQPDILRFADQGEEQVNGWSSESEGLQKRAPSLFKKLVGGDFGPAPKFHLINRDEQEQYYVVFTGTTVRVFSLDGEEIPVTADDLSYITSRSPRDDIRVVTVADYTFIVNRTKVVSKGTDLSYPGYNSKSRALINLRGGQYGRTLKVSINGGTEVSHTLPPGNNAETDPPKVDAQAIGEALRTLLVAAYPTYTFNLGSGYIEIVAPSGTDITVVETKDGYANQLINAVLDTVQTVSKLPLAAPNGYIIKIQGESGSSADEYYVKYNTTTKTWQETIAPGVVLGLNAATMPQGLIRQADGTFKLQPLSWRERGAGNDDTNPMPSFVDATINDVFFYRNRLGFLSGENVIMSRSAGYFAFFPKSVATLSDDDPIDVAVSHPRISVLKYAVPFAEQLLLWSDEVQFVMTSSGVLTSKSIQLDVGSEFAVSDAARPFTVGRSVFFSAPRGSFTSINRYFAVADVTDVKDADDTTGHVLSYIPNGVFDIQGSSTENFVSVLTTGAVNRVFIYKFLFKDGVQLQASWSHWELEEGREVLAISSIGSEIYMVTRDASGVTFETVKFIKEATDFEREPYRIHVDSKVETYVGPELYDPNTNITTFNLASLYGGNPQGEKYVIVTQAGAYTVVDRPSGGWGLNPTVKLKGDWSGVFVYVGRVYKFRYKFSRFLIKHEDQNGTVTEDTGRLQLRRAWVNYQSTGQLEALVANRSRVFDNHLNGYKAGDGVIGGVPLITGQWRIPMNGDARETSLVIESDAPTPVSIVGCGWEASYAKKAKSI